MTLIELGHVVGAALMTGRGRHTANWPKERVERYDEDKILTYVHPETGSHADGMRVLGQKLVELQRHIVTRRRVERRDWSSYVTSAQNSLSAGSVGSAKIKYAGMQNNGCRGGLSTSARL